MANAEPRAEGGPLNKNCGAILVQKARTFPTEYTISMYFVADDVAWMSFDGAEDRWVCLLRVGDNNSILQDSHRFAALVAHQVAYNVQARNFEDLRLGVE